MVTRTHLKVTLQVCCLSCLFLSFTENYEWRTFDFIIFCTECLNYFHKNILGALLSWRKHGMKLERNILTHFFPYNLSVTACYLKCNSIQQIPSRDAYIASPIREIHRILSNPKVHHRVHKSPPLFCILSHINPVHASILFPENAFKYYPPIYACVFQVVAFPRVSHQKLCMHLSFPTYMPHTLPFWFFLICSSWLYLMSTLKLLIMQFSPVACWLVPRSHKYVKWSEMVRGSLEQWRGSLFWK